MMYSKGKLEDYNKLDIARYIYRKLKKLSLRDRSRYVSLIAEETHDPFKILISTILSQNTNDKNSICAYYNLDKEVGITIDNLLKASQKEIAELIKIGGLHNVKARKIKKVTEEIARRYDSKLDWIGNESFENAREKLLELPGIGRKTADILLLYFNKPAFPVDTHITRITKRVGLVDKNASYDEISSIWKNALEKEDYKDAHLQLIAFGREICKARNPKCVKCPIKEVCEYYSEKHGEDSKSEKRSGR